MSRRPTSQSAFTLIEVMLAGTILLVSFAAVIQAVTMGAVMIDTARKQQIAQQIIEGEMNYQKSIPWNGGSGYGISVMPDSIFEIKVNDDGTDVVDETANGYTDSLRFGLDDNPALLAAAKGFTVRAESANEVGSGPPLIGIVWTVTWTSITGGTHSRTAKGYFSEHGLFLSYRK